MNISDQPMVRATRAGILLAFFIASILASFAIILGLREIGLFPDLESLNAQKTARELAVRLILALFLGATYSAVLRSEPMSGWFRARRWRTLILLLFGLGSLTALADPLHPITSEGNWIRYWTAGALLLAGVLGILHATRSEYPPTDRLFGVAFGSLLIAAAADEVFQLHEQLGRSFAGQSPLNGILHANDLPTLLVGVAGLVALGSLIAVRYYGGWLGRLLRQQRYRLPLRLFAFAVLAFLTATMLDAFDIYLQNGVDSLSAQISGSAGAVEDRLWLALSDVGELANAVEELLEFASALALLMMIATLFSIEKLGAAKRAEPA